MELDAPRGDGHPTTRIADADVGRAKLKKVIQKREFAVRAKRILEERKRPHDQRDSCTVLDTRNEGRCSRIGGTEHRATTID